MQHVESDTGDCGNLVVVILTSRLENIRILSEGAKEKSISLLQFWSFLLANSSFLIFECVRSVVI